jgi:hypothetical protein
MGLNPRSFLADIPLRLFFRVIGLHAFGRKNRISFTEPHKRVRDDGSPLREAKVWAGHFVRCDLIGAQDGKTSRHQRGAHVRDVLVEGPV